MIPKLAVLLLLHSTLLLLHGSSPKGREESLFLGNHNFTDDELTRYLSVQGLDLEGKKDWAWADWNHLHRSLEDFYQSRGFPLVRVEAGRMQPSSPILILEGPRSRLRQVRFRGNRILSQEELESFFTLGDWYDSSAIAESLDQIRFHYRNRGYREAEIVMVSRQVVEFQDSSHFPLPFQNTTHQGALVTFQVLEGSRYRYGETRLSGFLEGRVKPPQAGELYRQSDIQELTEEIARSCEREGRLIKSLQILEKVPSGSSRIDLEILLELYPPLIVRKIEFLGNERYPDSFFRRELTINEEEIFHPGKLEESLENLRETGALIQITPEQIELAIDELKHEVELRFHLEEVKRQWVFYTLGGDGLGGIQGTLFYNLINLFGLNETLGLEVSAGDQTSLLALSLASRYLLGTQVPISLALSVFRRQTGLKVPGLEDEVRSLFSSKGVGISGIVRYQKSSKQDAGLDFTLETIEVNNRQRNHLEFKPFWKQTWEGSDEEVFLETSQRFSFSGGDQLSWSWRPSLQLQTSMPRGSGDELRLRFQGDYVAFFGPELFLSDRLLPQGEEVRGLPAITSGPWGIRDEKAFPIGADLVLGGSAEYEMRAGEKLTLLPYLDYGMQLALTQPMDVQLISETSQLFQTSVGTEFQFDLAQSLPTTRLIFSWNPLRLDTDFFTENGWSRLEDPLFNFRVGFGAR